MKEKDVLLKIKNISIEFPGVKALDKVDFNLRSGEIHALMGENGAGKSTLIKVLTGVEKLDSGDIVFLGNKINPKSTYEAQELGISTVYQEVNLCNNISVAENIFIGREPMKFGMINWKEMNRRAVIAMKKLSIDIDVTKSLDNYSLAIQQMVAIARAVDIESKILILDEPTASLDEKEVEKLFKIMRNLKDQGIGIIFVTHFLDQVYEITDNITVLRNGKLVGEYKTSELSKVQLVAKMIGKDYSEINSNLKSSESINIENEREILLEAIKLGKRNVLKSFDTVIYKGEVLGLAGLLGSGRTELVNLLFGIEKADTGDIIINNKKKKIGNPLEAMKNEIAYCPEDRKREGIIPNLSIRENIILALQVKQGWFKYIPIKEQEKVAEEYIKLLDIKTPSSEKLVRELSGGNQQKVILARWLLTKPKLLILDEPTRGIDIGTKAEIQKVVLDLSAQGISVIFISSELDEMIRTCSRLIVLRDRHKIEELVGKDLDTNVIMNTIAGGN
ncbi:MAG: sugar ABC transporter ATP-binding protein [Clostridium sp.]|uniref:sugar ABC transporter ATP-binding protein n=1 Tax=Clostridium sp. TaxID=1506 RepID=UPI001DB03E32|nr:sugar ABC transporter ATP-binding protein [Clostridium sp.]MBS5938788.1 sugar ABC transporter ATP-binding protein [Clostridium sp.]MBS5950857.1 sugar ABC transporter ATP-binding protein [Clostridium sp.]